MELKDKTLWRIPLEETIERLLKNSKQNFTKQEGFSLGFTGSTDTKKDED